MIVWAVLARGLYFRMNFFFFNDFSKMCFILHHFCERQEKRFTLPTRKLSLSVYLVKRPGAKAGEKEICPSFTRQLCTLYKMWMNPSGVYKISELLKSNQNHLPWVLKSSLSLGTQISGKYCSARHHGFLGRSDSRLSWAVLGWMEVMFTHL